MAKKQNARLYSTPEVLWVVAFAILLFVISLPFPWIFATASQRGSHQQVAPNTHAATQQPSEARLRDLDDLDQLRRLFQSDSKRVRLISLLSPT